LLLKHYYGFSYEEISNMMCMKEGTVKSRIHKSLKKIREEMKDNEE
jgi:RNA polymerase sigma-70 factor, ECF subfamily